MSHKQNENDSLRTLAELQIQLCENRQDLNHNNPVVRQMAQLAEQKMAEDIKRLLNEIQ